MTNHPGLDRTDLPTLFQRLLWPSGLVRERACVAIADLLMSPATAATALDFLLEWQAARELESEAVLGLLPLLRAQSERGAVLDGISITEIAGAVRHPSLLSRLLLEELSPAAVFEEETQLHSGTAPPDFAPEASFDKLVRSALPPLYDMRASGLERMGAVGFRRQWEYEWRLLLERVGTVPSANILDFWLRPDMNGERYVAVDTRLSEVYRSAYLRALAWAAQHALISREAAPFLVAEACPIDLGLWKFGPGPTPQWWPHLEEGAEIATALGAVWQQVDELWRQQETSDIKGLGREWVLARASGPVASVSAGSEPCDLEILGVFQKPIGPRPPESEESWEDLEDADWQPDIRTPSLVRFEGSVYGPREPNVVVSGHWELVPAASPAKLNTSLLWQYWRIYRGVWLPAPYLLNRPFDFTCTDTGVVASVGDVDIGYWRDWTTGVGEKLTQGAPPAAGEHLVVARQLVEEFAADTGSTFCWLCRLSMYVNRERWYEPSKRYSEHRVIGASRVIRLD